MKKQLDKIYAYIPEDDIVGTASTKRGVPHQYVDVEYVRKDTFIERVVDYIANNMRCNEYTLQTKAKFIKEFRNYMKGE